MTVEQDFEAVDQFPVGMRVLAVDDDQTCLRILETLLHRCQYHVITTDSAQTALELLRENRNKFDLVISDVDMPDMDGFKLLELVGLEMDLPVIMLSAHSDPKYVMKGVKHGACDYLLKPVRIEELKNIWQHVVRKSKFKKMKSVVTNGESDQNGVKANRKRKDQFEEEGEEDEERGNENDDPTAQKKPRVLWTRELHNKFLAAVDHLGVEKAQPKKILELMNVDKLTRENVASHLQKFRSALKKITNEANQQANMAAIDSHFMQISSLKGLGGFNHQRQIPQFQGGVATMRHYPLGRLNSFAGMFPHVSSSLPRNHNDGGYILQGMPIPPLDDNKAFPSFSSQQRSLMVAPNNQLVLQGQQQSSYPSLNPGFSPNFEINKRLEDWSNALLPTNIPQSGVHSNMDTTNPTSFCRNMDVGSSNAAQVDLSVNNLGLFMGQEKLENGSMPSDAGSLDDIVNSMMPKEQSQVEFFEGDLGFGWHNSSLRTCI